VGVSVEVTRDKEGNVTRRDAEVRSVRAEQAIYIDRSEDMLLAPPQAYLHTVKSVNRKTQVTQLLRINGVLVSTKGHYIVHVNGSIRLEWFHVLGLKRLEEFIGYEVEQLVIPDQTGLLLPQNLIEGVKKEFEVGLDAVG
jgi:hypothetical protein